MISGRIKKRSSGFTLVEVLVATVLVAVGIVGTLGGIAAIQRSDAKIQDADLLQRLAAEKMNDVKYQSDPTQAGTGGDFTDRGYSDITWTSDVATTSIANVDQVTVTVTHGADTQALTTMIYVAPQTSTSNSTSSTTSGATGP